MKTWLAVALLSAALGAQAAYSLKAAATVVNVDEFAVVRNGTTIFDDNFDQNTTLIGGSGTPGVPSGTNFSDGTPATYFVQGSFSETTANNGQALLDTANGRLIAQPPPNIPLISEVALRFKPGTTPPGRAP